MTNISVEESVKKLPVSRQKIISLFLRKRRKVLTREEISKGIGKRGKALGGVLGGFSQSKTKLLLQVSKDRWIINEKYESELKRVIAKLEKYIW